jgi:hypothetical protein
MDWLRGQFLDEPAHPLKALSNSGGDNNKCGLGKRKP